MNNRTQQRFDKSIREAIATNQTTKAREEREYFLKMLPVWERRAGIIANMLETGQSGGKDLPDNILSQLNFDLAVLNAKIKHAIELR